LTVVKAEFTASVSMAGILKQNSTLRSPSMNLQKIFERSENKAVAVIVLLFIVFHFGILYLIANN